ncbi:hypothetical protein [Acinetobacter radioresistens]|uniref:hypothetical protein n=1 Tax=Acinetobacter radioresistens TaxID=40216 RepID=UPI0011A35A09|nr:hypothetical protein [Acinetobacter radioresistens]MCK4115381.1 hypothetical protein [Acinetobacter radioresistens]MCU4607316.1 hypothetical protein [Acinetobacter radioresistens]MCU4623089.1 hypothetical protein [Acinetobacter radioresistens]
MMKLIYGSTDFNDLLQECFLARTSILSGIEYLIKANIYDESDGLFYSSFFSLSIGIERFLKIALVAEYMYTHNFQKPNEKFLTQKSHNILKLFNECAEVTSKYNITIMPLDNNPLAYELFNFISSYATKNRYQNLNKLTNKYDKYDKHPIHAWFEISKNYLSQNFSGEKINRELLKYYNKYPHAIGFSPYLDFHGHPLLYPDLLMCQYVVKKSKPYIINDLIQTLKPIYTMLDQISFDCNNGPNADPSGPVKLPYFGELFPIFYSDIDQYKRLKKWVDRY